MSIVNVNQIQPVGSGQTVTINAANISAGSATITAATINSSGISTFSNTINVGAGKSIRLYGATSGYTDIIAAAGSASTTFTLPSTGGSSAQVLSTDGSGNMSWVERGRMVLETAKSSSSGSSVEFTNIPSWVKKITIIFVGVSLTGEDNILVQVGSGSYLTSSYKSSGCYVIGGTTSGTNNSTSGILLGWGAGSGNLHTGNMSLNLLGSSRIWVGTSQNDFDNLTGYLGWSAGKTPALSGALDRLRIVPAGSNTFDAGTINVLYEGY